VDKLYCCYSLNLRNFLYQNGLRYELAAKNPNSDKLFWVYIRNEKLDELLTKWTAKE
jgi:hypothetical protein